ncbi:MAG: fibronectin type III domain-containing protein [Myxococcales bacterium]|nr:fibronectin type III domain-containing protein [Myxococcales bacterium]
MFKRTALVLSLMFVAVAAEAKPRWVRVSVPAENADSSIVIAWNTDDAPDDNFVEFGAGPGTAFETTQTGTSFQAKGQLGTVHEVTLTGLSAETAYTYRVGGPVGGYSDVHSFRTGPNDGCTPFRFIASGDHRSDDDFGPSPKWESILGEMEATGATFVVETGDLVKDGEDLKQWVNHMDMGALHMGELALMPSFGNHDSDDVQGVSAAFNQLFSLPTNDKSATEDFYAFEYGNAVFAGLSTATFDDPEGFAMQAQWLDETLAEHADKTWRFVFFHHPVYTSHIDLGFAELNHPPDERGQAQHFVPIFDKHHVDVVFAGHNHFYERFAPMKGGEVVGSPADGTVYVTTGGAGAFTYDEIDVFGFKVEPMSIICGDGLLGLSGKAKGSQLCSGKHHYMEVELDGPTLSVVVRSTAAQNFSTSQDNVAVIDTFSITKSPGPLDECAPPEVPDEAPVDPGPADAGSADVGPVDAGPVEPADAGPADASGPIETDAGPIDADAGPVESDVGTSAPDGSPDSGTSVIGADTKGSGVPSEPTGGTTASSGESSGGCTAGGGQGGPDAVAGLLLLLLGMGAGLRRLHN